MVSRRTWDMLPAMTTDPLDDLDDDLSVDSPEDIPAPEPRGTDWEESEPQEVEDLDGLDEVEPQGEDVDAWATDQPGMSEEDWSSLEDECSSLAPGRVLVGWREFISIPQLRLSGVVARMDTGVADSRIYGTATSQSPGRVCLQIQGTEAEVSGVVDEAGAVVELTISLGGTTRNVQFQVDPESSPQPVVLGRNALEGYLVVDVTMSFLHKRTDGAGPGS